MKTLLLTLSFLLWGFGMLYPQTYTDYYLQGKDKVLNKNYKEAIIDFTKAIELKPNSAVLYASRAETKTNIYEYESAVDDYTKAIELNPDDISLYLKRGILYNKLNLTEKANSDFALITGKEYEGIEKAYAFFYLGEKEAAIAEMKQMIKNDPNKWNYYKLSCLYAMQNKQKDALVTLETAIKKGFNNYHHIFSDEELESLHFTNGFKELMNSLGIKYEFDYHAKVQKYVQEKLVKWQQKGKYEKSDDYFARVTVENRNKQIELLKAEKIEEYKKNYVKGIEWTKASIEGYDPDSESFKINLGDPGSFILPVPINEAEIFEKNFKKTTIGNVDILLKKEKIVLSILSVFNPVNSKSYLFDITREADYNPSDFEIKFDDIQADISDVEVTTDTSGKNKDAGQKNKVLPKSDIDLNIPVTKDKRENCYVLIIGNEDYSSYQTDLSSEVNVLYAINDAAVFKEYVIKTLGVPQKNIIFLTNATFGQMNQAITKVSTLAKVDEGNAEIIMYYAGHGLPDEKTKEPYLIPVDIHGSSVSSGIKLTDLYNRLTEFPSQRVTVFLDACFSGGARNQSLIAMRGVKIKPKDTYLSGNIVVFSSSSGDESSAPYKEKKHGMFTYFLLKKLKESKGKVTYKELAEYISKNVKREAVLVNNKEQNPVVIASPAINNEWERWKLK